MITVEACTIKVHDATATATATTTTTATATATTEMLKHGSAGSAGSGASVKKSELE